MSSFRAGPGRTRPRFAGKIVKVTWDDASWDSRQVPLADVEEGFVCETFGLCMRETKKGLTVVMDVPQGMDEVRHSSFVPWGMVKAVKVYGTEWTVKRKA